MIKSIGIELEGGLNKTELSKIERWVIKNNLTRFYQSKRDGSVSVRKKTITNAELLFWNTDKEKVFEFLEVCYNNGFETNKSCGFHIHLKFDDMENMINMISHYKIQKEFIKAYKEWASRKAPKYERRLTNYYCLGKTTSNGIINNMSGYGTRYKAINLSSLRTHKTIEFRIMPNQISSDEAKETINWLIETLGKLLIKKTKVIASYRFKLGETKKLIDDHRNQLLNHKNLKEGYINV